MTTTTRRDFLKVVGAGGCALSVGGLTACGGPSGGVVDAGNVSDLAVGTVKAIDGEGVLVGRDDGGVYAMTAICTHLGCDLSGPDGTIDTDGSIHCGCHGSGFNADGSVANGPASAPLQHFKVAIDDAGAITVDTSDAGKAGATDRTAVPAG